MRVLLISPYSLGATHWMPVGLAFMAAELRRRGHTPLIFDRYARQAHLEESLPAVNTAMLDCVRDFQPDLIGLSTISQIIYDTVDCAALLRTVYSGPLIAGGYHATALPALTLQKIPELDGVVTGEGEFVLSQLANGQPPAQLPGVWWRLGESTQPPATPALQIKHLDELPLPAFDLMDMLFYTQRTRFSIRGYNLSTTTLITSRGCHRHCSFCAESLTYGPGVRFHSPAYVLEWIQRVVTDYGVDGLHLHDNDFLADEQRARTICAGIRQYGWRRRVKWSIQTRADRLNPDIAAELKASGCVLVEIGIETATQAGLDQIDKGTTLEMNKRAAGICRRAGLDVHAYMLTRLEGETLADLEQRLTWVKRVRPASFQWSDLVMHPGTALYRERGGDFFARSAWNKAAIDEYYAADFLSAIPASQRRAWMKRHLGSYMQWLNRLYILRHEPLSKIVSVVIIRLKKKFSHRAAAATPPATFCAAYTGYSMHPTLVEPELMEIAPYGESLVRAGDVVFCDHPGQAGPVIHRVRRVTAAGIVTRGDNNAQDDEGYVQPEAIRGRVTAAWRGQQRRAIHSGRAGQVWGWLMRGRRLLLHALRRLLHGPYHILARSGIVRRLAPAALRPHVLVFQNGETRQFQLVLGQRVVGRYNTDQQTWHIQPLYRLLVDERSLPPEHL